MNKELIELAVVEMKKLYVRLRGLTARKMGHAAHNEPKWYALAEELLSCGANPMRYVRWAYDLYRQSNPEVFVAMIVSPKTLRIFMKDSPDFEADARLMIRLQADTLNRQLEAGRDPSEVIRDNFLDLGPVFRYALAIQHGLSEYEQELRGPAELEMACEPLYQQLVSGILRSAENARAVRCTTGDQ